MASTPAGSPKGASVASLPAPLVMVDNDECVGSWGDLSLLYTVHTHVLHVAPPVELFSQLLTATGCARPHLRELYDNLMALKREGKLSGVYMVTSARDTVGWVSFLRQVLEAWYGEALYDGMIEGTMISKYNEEHGVPQTDSNGSVIKDMNQLRQLAGVPLATRVFCIDDRPACILNGEAFGVSPYTVAVNLVEVCREFVAEWTPALESRYSWTLQETWRTFHRSPSHFTVAWRDECLAKASGFVTESLKGRVVLSPKRSAMDPPGSSPKRATAPAAASRTHA